MQKTLCFMTHSCGAAAMDTMSHDAGKYFVWDTQNTVWTSKRAQCGTFKFEVPSFWIKVSFKIFMSEGVKRLGFNTNLKYTNLCSWDQHVALIWWMDTWLYLDSHGADFSNYELKKKKNQKTLFPLKTLQGSNDHPIQTWQIKCCWEPAVSLLSNTKP